MTDPVATNFHIIGAEDSSEGRPGAEEAVPIING